MVFGRWLLSIAPVCNGPKCVIVLRMGWRSQTIMYPLVASEIGCWEGAADRG